MYGFQSYDVFSLMRFVSVSESASRLPLWVGRKGILFLLFLLALPLSAQNSKKVQQLKREKTELQNKIKKTNEDLNKTRQQVKTGQQSVNFLGLQMNNRLDRIRELETEMENLDRDILDLQRQLTQIDRELQGKRDRLRTAMRYARSQREYQNPLVFIFSARTVTQMYRRARYAREYVAYERNLGEQILRRQNEKLETQNSLLTAKSQKNSTVTEIMQQRKALSEQQVKEQHKVDGLKKQETGLAGQVKEQQKQLTALDKKIDALIAYEIEQARKRAEEAARKKREAEEAARKKKAAQKKSTTTKSGTTSGKSGTAGKTTAPTKSTPAGKPETWLTAEDRMLSGSFEQNKGRLPVPITGQYMKAGHFGIYNVPGMKNVQLDNKGANYVGKPGARARCIFDGVVTSVFQFGGTRNVLVRHGSYISVYCNLSSVIVAKDQKVKARDILGSVADDGSGNCTLHFQLRKETTKLNPDAWIGR